MTTPHHTGTVACSFCGKGPDEVERLIAGPDAWICDGCVRVCHGVLEGLDDAEPVGDPPDPVMAEIAAAQQAALRGERAAAAAAFAGIWERLGPDGEPLHRATLAHYMADVQDDPADELEWDSRALAAAEAVADDPTIRGLVASLEVNIAADLAKLGRPEDARRHLAAAEAAQAQLPPDGYGELVRTEIAALRSRLP